MKSRPQRLLGGLVSAAFIATASAAVVSYDFTGPTALPSVLDPNASATAFSVSPGNFALIGLVFGNPFPSATADDWSVAPPSPSAKRFAFTVTADPGYSLQLTSLSFDNYSPNPIGPAKGPTSYAVALNGTLVGGPAATSVNSWGSVSIPLPFSGSSALVEIYAWGGTSQAIFNAVTQGWAVDNVTLEGAVVPEPGGLGLLAAFGLGGFAFWRRSRRT